MKTKTKALLISVCAVLLIAALGFTTLAYLTDNANVTNTFTVGNVQIDLDEALVDEYGNPLKKADDDSTSKVTLGEATRVSENNEYKLVPNHTYSKDPTVTVKASSEDCYVRLFVTMTQISQWDDKLDDYPNAKNGTEAFTTLDIIGTLKADWKLYKTTNDATNNTRTYEFRYEKKIDYNKTTDQKVTPFTEISVPYVLTKEDLQAIDGGSAVGTVAKKAKMYFYAEAIQADGFEEDTENTITAADVALNKLPAPTTKTLTNGEINSDVVPS
ncbi:MAG: SipW-dependent-type signal peptide-containing protein [Acutalibacteraceae bacterium]